MKKIDEIKKLQYICFWLIARCREANATRLKIQQKNVTHKGRKIGDWEILIKKYEKNLQKK